VADKSAANPKSQIVNPQSQMSHLRPTAVEPAKGVSLVEAKPLPRSEPSPRPTGSSEQQAKATSSLPSVEPAPARKPLKEIAQPAAEATPQPAEGQLVKSQPMVRILQPSGPSPKNTSSVAQASNSTDEENLPPIVPSWAVPRPGTKKRASSAGRPELISSTSVQNPKPQVINPGSSTMRIELGNPEPRSPATIVLAPNAAAPSAPQTLRPISPTAGQAAPVKLPPSRDDQKRSDSMRPGINNGSPFLKPVTYLNDSAGPTASVAGAALSNSPYTMPPGAPPRIEQTPAPSTQEPRLLPMPLEISNPYIGK